MTWEEIRDNLQKGNDSIIFGFGSIEQHGLHLPICTDTIIAEKICELVAENLDNILISPALRIGFSDHHMALSGTISISKPVLENYLIDYCNSLLHHGFKNIFILTTHGGNFSVVDNVEEHFASLEGAQVKSCIKGQRLIHVLHDAATSLNIPLESAGAHAGELETSILLYLFDNIVRTDKLTKGFVGDYDAAKKDSKDGDITKMSELGVIGDSTIATKEHGKEYVEKLVEAIINNIERMRN